MKVKVTYGIELSSVPDLVESMLDEASSSLEKQLNKIKALKCMVSDSTLVELVPNILDEIRKEVSSLDLTMSDAQMILGGYVKVSSDDFVPPSPAIEDPEPEAASHGAEKILQQEQESYEKVVRSYQESQDG